MKQNKKSKRFSWLQVLIWALFAAVMVGVAIVGTSIMSNGPQIHTVVILLILFVLAFFGGWIHSYVDWKVSSQQEREEDKK